MPGMRSGRGCEGCRKRKKKCDLVQPSCSRCLRYGIRCIGSGERVFKFKNATVTDGAPLAQTAGHEIQTALSRPLGNELSTITGAFVSTLKISDPKYSIHGFGSFLEDVPRRLARSEMLRSSAKAFSAAVTAVHSPSAVVQAFKDYGAALTCMRNGLINDECQVKRSETLCAVYLLMLSQNFLRGHNDDCLVHMQGLLHILNSQDPYEKDAFSSQLVELTSIMAITDSILDPRVQLEPWHSDLKKTAYHGPSNGYSVIDIRSTNLSVAPLMEIVRCLQEPENHMLQLRSSYNLMILELEKLLPITIQLNAACKTSKDFAYFKGYAVCESSVCVLSNLMAVLRRTLQIFHPQDTTFEEQAAKAADEVLASATRAWNFRPLGTTYMPKTLCVTWATTDNPAIKARLEDMIDSYREDFRGDSWIKLALLYERRFDLLRRRVQSKMPHHIRQDTTSPGSTNAGSESINGSASSV